MIEKRKEHNALCERLKYIATIGTLMVATFALLVFGVEWVYGLWAQDAGDWVVSFVAIPFIALVCALAIYLFSYAMEDPSLHGEERTPYDGRL